jgi:GH24 family phage-related lysozyme (muramidase)
MSAMQNHQLEEGRDAIVSNLFGVGVGKRPVEMVRQVKAGDVKLI